MQVEVGLLALCEKTILDHEYHRPTLVNVFDRVTFAPNDGKSGVKLALPAKFKVEGYLVLRAYPSIPPAEVEIVTQFVDPDNEPLITYPIHKGTPSQNEGLATMILPIQMVAFQRPGRHYFVVSARDARSDDDRWYPVGRSRLDIVVLGEVEITPAPQPSPPTQSNPPDPD